MLFLWNLPSGNVQTVNTTKLTNSNITLQSNSVYGQCAGGWVVSFLKGFAVWLVFFVKAFVPVGKTDKCSLSLTVMGSWKSSVPVFSTVLMGKAQLYSWLDNSAVSKRYHGDHLCNITTTFHNSSI